MKLIIAYTIIAIFALFQSAFEILETADAIVGTVSAILGFILGYFSETREHKKKLADLQENVTKVIQANRLDKEIAEKTLRLNQTERGNNHGIQKPTTITKQKTQ